MHVVMRQVPGKAGKSSLWVRVGCRDVHGRAQEHRDICSIAQVRARGLTQSLMLLPRKQEQSPTRFLPAPAHAVPLPVTWEHICAMSELACAQVGKPREEDMHGWKEVAEPVVALEANSEC